MHIIENYLIQEGILETFNKILFEKLARTIEVLKATKVKVDMIPSSVKALVSKLYKSLPFVTKNIERTPEFMGYKKYAESLLSASKKINLNDLNLKTAVLETTIYMSMYKAKKDNSNVKVNIRFYIKTLSDRFLKHSDPLTIKFMVASIYITLLYHTIRIESIDPMLSEGILYVYIIVSIIFVLMILFNIDLIKLKK